MKQTPNELHNELMDKLKEFTEEVGYHLPPDKIPDTTKSLINLFITYSTPPNSGGRIPSF